VFVTGAAGSVTNNAGISGYHGVGLEAGGTFTNNAGATVSGSTSGVFIAGGAGTFNNAGTVTASGAAGADIEGGGSVSNASGGSISGSSFGIFLSGGAGTVTNNGSISSVNSFGIDLTGGGSVTNGAGASISGPGIGVAVYGGSGTVTNSGTISGGFNAVRFANSGANRLVVNPTAVFNGAVVGASGAASNTLELAGGTGSIAASSAGYGTVTANGNSWSFSNFGTVAVDTGGNWTLNGGNVATVVDNGTIGVTGSVNISGAIDPASAGLFQLNSGATLAVAAALGTNSQMTFQTGSELVIDNPSVFGINIGSTAYAGPLLEGFAAGDTIDVEQFGAAGVAPQLDSTTGLLQLSNSAQQTASLQFQTASLGSGTFHATSDGATGIVVTLS
ncbi:MAG: hypothetical protein P4L90_13650, partial [Rhodopila sp.]|nr:hypothetical protein [Rhodopila sp.]